MEDCIFCKIAKGDIPCEKIYEDEEILAFLDIAPVNIGHTLVIPKKHFKNIYETPDDTSAKMMLVAKKISTAIKALPSDGVNITMNNDPAAGQVVFHSHIHIIPRLENDGFGIWSSKRSYEEGEGEETARKITQGL